MRLRPLNLDGRILVKILRGDRKTASGIILADTKREPLCIAEVLRTSDYIQTLKGVRMEHEVKAGDKILINRHAGGQHSVNDEYETRVILHTDPLAVVDE